MCVGSYDDHYLILCQFIGEKRALRLLESVRKRLQENSQRAITLRKAEIATLRARALRAEQRASKWRAEADRLTKAAARAGKRKKAKE